MKTYKNIYHGNNSVQVCAHFQKKYTYFIVLILYYSISNICEPENPVSQLPLQACSTEVAFAHARSVFQRLRTKGS